MANKINNLTPDEWYDKFTQALEKSKTDFEHLLKKQNAEYTKSRKESDEAFDKRMEKSNADFEKWKKESESDLKQWRKEMQKNIGGISDANGKMVEEALFSVLEKDLTFAGIKFDDIDRNVKLKFKKLKLEGEFDIVLTNGDTIGLIEAKYSVRKNYVTELFSSKVDKFRTLFPQFSGYKFVLGIAGASFDENAIDEANKNGIGLIKVVGEKVEFHTENIKKY